MYVWQGTASNYEDVKKYVAKTNMVFIQEQLWPPYAATTLLLAKGTCKFTFIILGCH